MRDTRLSESPEPSEPTEHYLFNDSQTIVLERGYQWESTLGSTPDRNPIERERITAHGAVRGLAELCDGLVRPMTFGVTRNWVDGYGLPAEGSPPRGNWILTTPQSPPDVHSTYRDPQIMEAATLDERAMLTMVDRVLDDPCEAPEGKHLAWDEMHIDHTWARLPEPDRHLANKELRIDDHDNKLRRVLVPREHAHGRTWVTVPRRSVRYPFLLRVNKSCGTVYPDGPGYDDFITMTIDVNWSFWWHPGEGRAMLDQAVDRLLRKGWRPAHPQSVPTGHHTPSRTSL
ncbi:hypothetical protein SAMN05428945_5120 [Streptomyces sp. 2224.1]|uniref:hypothetical protein n=1 Tax=unclassified Streptomyces TaxID=2593676 RepID=UPI00087E4DAE|nr:MULTISPECIES: hypothetical protein [unclassified Streptomyces]PBC80389.1 hypothetical protein BX261_0212 [Streptomyces sp. 2321.6]SDR58864.1 hypothetical protein SAMN05216511_7011 [Streptomyces sp. KS_16]SEB72781.1 hypothetical protein SAMN05428940_0213 [Streptomyces sp. 2133.1]SED51172.1 hypothetical protein SAMN05428945_5120 [Streptomyces sp. 2224.1]SEF17811.1 hypothetical protein SAMN05428954_7062 [Streptomyces sp. 2112.3]